MTRDSDAATDIASRCTRLIFTGGFLRTGKTTLLMWLGELLSDRDRRIGLSWRGSAGRPFYCHHG